MNEWGWRIIDADTNQPVSVSYIAYPDKAIDALYGHIKNKPGCDFFLSDRNGRPTPVSALL